MAVQVEMTWRVVGDDEIQFTSAFGHLDEAEEESTAEVTPTPVDRILNLESSTIAPGLARQVG